MTTQVTELKNSEELVRQSLKQYRDMFDLLNSLSQHLDVQLAENIQQFNEAFSTLHEGAQAVDQELMERLRLTEIPEDMDQYLAQRKSLQEQILRLLKETVPKANSVKALLASEMQFIKHGRTALTGYKTHSLPQGKIVSKKS